MVLTRTVRKRIALALYGQSNQHGAVPVTEQAAYPLAFTSARKPSMSVPLAPAVTRQGGWWQYVHDELWDWGYDTQIINGAIGGLSFGSMSAGWLQGRNSSFPYYGFREPNGRGDRGDFGELIMVGTRVFQCVVGRARYYYASGGLPDATGAPLRDGVALVGTHLSAASQPAALSTAAVGDLVVDGDVTWKCLSTTGTSSGPYANGATVGDFGRYLTEKAIGYGHDPLSRMQVVLERLQSISDVTRKIVFIQNGEADLGASQLAYSERLQGVAGRFLASGMEVMIGLTIWSPSSGGATSGNYASLEAGRQDALTALKAAYPGKVWDGPNLYALMGTTGPMAAAGAGFLQADGVHLNGRGCVGPPLSGVDPAGKHVSDSLKLALPPVAGV